MTSPDIHCALLRGSSGAQGKSAGLREVKPLIPRGLSSMRIDLISNGLASSHLLQACSSLGRPSVVPAG